MSVVGLDTIVFSAPDMKAARRYAADWGLRKVKDGRAGAVFETEIGSQIVLRPPSAKDLPAPAAPGMNFREMIWGVSSRRELKRIATTIAAERPVTEDADGTIHCADPNGIGLGFRVWRGRKNFKGKRAAVNTYGKAERVDARGTFYERAKPMRMGHIGFLLPDLKASEDFYHKLLGWPVSDRYGPGMAVFFRCAPESDHHNMLLIKSRSGDKRFHHVAFEVRDVHEVFGGGLYFQRKGWPVEVGPGRHPISSAYFWYFKTPMEGAFEYFSDSDWMTKKWKGTTFRVNKFSEWHLVDGIPMLGDNSGRPGISVVAAK